MDGRGSVVPEALEWSSGREGAYKCLILHHTTLGSTHWPLSSVWQNVGGFNPDSLSPSQPRLTEPDLFRGESGASRSTLERKILGPSSFSTGVSGHMEAGQRWKRENTGIRSKLAFLFAHFSRGGWIKWTKQTHIFQLGSVSTKKESSWKRS